MERIHDEEVDTSEATVRALLHEQCPAWVESPLTDLATTGTSNRLWRVHTDPGRPDVVLRLPRQESAAEAINRELDLLPRLADSALSELVAVPSVVHEGRPAAGFALPWMACTWLDGTDAWSTRSRAAADPRLAAELAQVIRCLRSIVDLGLDTRRPGQRGGPLGPVLDSADRWLSDPRWRANTILDVARVRSLLTAARAHENDDYEASVLHGDLLPGNLLVDDTGRLRAVIDWGGAGVGDPAEDLAPAWSIFDRTARAVFRSELDPDDDTWARARAIELTHAVAGVLYYRPRNHPLGDVMAATLDRILSDD